MSSEFGSRLKVSIFGQSHGRAIGCVVDGFPAGEAIDMEALSAFMQRRRGGKGKISTARAEADEVEFLSGVENGKTCAFPLCAVIRNADTRSKDYSALKDTPRPGHADFTARVKWGENADMRGGGHFSGRLTAPICAAGGIAKQILARKGVYVGAHLLRISDETDESFPLYPDEKLFETVARKEIPTLDDEAGRRMKEKIENARSEMDSLGGIVECAILNLPAGLGGPMFDGVENIIARALFGVPAVKGVEFGAGFACASMRGSENNDQMYVAQDGSVKARTNHAGGILGGITNGMPVVVRAAFKPTPSIARAQRTVNLQTMQNTEIEISGRHDPTVVVRAVPVVEAICALCALDIMLEG